MQRGLVLVAVTLFAALGIGSSVALAGGGNSVNAKLCQQDGWQQLQTATGGSFASDGACVAYGAQGGTLFAPTLAVTSPISANGIGTVSQHFTVTGAGFHASTSGKLTVTSSFGELTWSPQPSGTDANGNFTLSNQAWLIGAPCNFVATWTYTDSFGVQASATQVVNGCGT